MALKWSEELSVGVEAIDNQHKSIFAMANNLFDAMEAGHGKEEVAETIAFLRKYISEHFCDEEELMINHNFPGYAEQRKEHKQFLTKYLALEAEFEAKGASSHFVVETQLFLSSWLINHINKSDKAIGVFLKKAKRPQA